MRPRSYVDVARDHLRRAEGELLEVFGRERLEETAFPVYAHSFPPAAYLGWRRVAHAQRMLDAARGGDRALDFGAGCGVMLPYLSQRYRQVIAFDVDYGPTKLMIQRMGLPNVVPVSSLDGQRAPFDAVVALDVLEHVDDLGAVYADLLPRTSPGGSWVISGPTENWLYRLMRKVARTAGEGHVRTIADVLAAVPPIMRRTDSVRLPFGSPVPLFVVAKYDRA